MRYESKTLPEFWEAYYALPAQVRKIARDAYQRFAENPNHPGLRFKPLKGNSDFYSARITKGYRVVGIVDGDTVTWFWIGTKADFTGRF